MFAITVIIGLLIALVIILAHLFIDKFKDGGDFK